MELKIFKIKDSVTGLFSTGGTSPTWTKKGKTWNQINHIKTHLRQHCDYKIIKPAATLRDRPEFDYKTISNNIPETWIVVEMIADGVKSEMREYSARDLYPLEFPS